MKKVCLIASSGGHFEQIKRLKKLEKNFKIFYVTERTPVAQNADYYLKQINRKEKKWIIKFLSNFFVSLKIFLGEKPNIIISTGALATLPMLIIGKIFGVKVIFIESFAKVTTPTLTGRLAYKFVDLFIIQWKELKKYYPNAIYGGGIY